MPSLRIQLPDNGGEVVHVLAGQQITIGRRPDNTIQIADRSVSGHHAELIITNGHYRLHDLGSTNFTFVDGQPVKDFHLHQQCRISFGSVECEFSPETPVVEEEGAVEAVPTRSELEFFRRENLDLQAKIASLQKQIDILSSARLVTKETTQLGVAPEAHKRVVVQRDEFRSENQVLKNSVESLKADVISLTRERDAIRQAWETVKVELGAARAEIAALSANAAAAADAAESLNLTPESESVAEPAQVPVQV